MNRAIILFITIPHLLLSPYLLSQEITAEDYRIGPQDLLEISVFGRDELNRRVRVSEDGKITLPLLGEVEVGGLSRAELERELGRLYQEGKILQNPQVTVFILEYQSRRVSVLGAVQAPGPYELIGQQRLLQIISRAGGFTPEIGKEIIVMRQHEDGTQMSIIISMADLMTGGDSKLNILLRPNDIINVQVDNVITIYVFGQVNNPGSLEMRKSNIPTLLRAIAQAGGFTPRASKKRVLIRRKSEDGKEIKIKINAKAIIKGKKKDVQLKENDVVYVRGTAF